MSHWFPIPLRCEFCDELLEDFTGLHHQPPDRARCSFCGQPHGLTEEGVWVAMDR